MAIVVFGERSMNIGLDEMFVKCPACDSHQYADVMVVSNYYHFYFCPVFPTGKHLDIICQKCGLKRYGIGFDSNTIPDYELAKRKYRHPAITYSGAIIIAVIVVGGILSYIVS